MRLSAPCAAPQINDPFFHQLKEEFHEHMAHAPGEDSMCGRYCGIDGCQKLCRSRCAMSFKAAGVGSVGAGLQYCTNMPASKSIYCQAWQSPLKCSQKR